MDAPLALALSALLLLIPATVEPLLGVASHGAERTCWLWSGIAGLWQEGFAPLAVIVGAFCVAFPYIYLAALIAVLAGLRLGARAYLGPVFRWLMGLRPWMMLEIFLVGCFVAYSRLRLVVGVHVLAGGWCLMAATGALLFRADAARRAHGMGGPAVAARARPGVALGIWAGARSDRRDRNQAIACTACELLVTGARAGAPARAARPRCIIASRIRSGSPLPSWRRLSCFTSRPTRSRC